MSANTGSIILRDLEDTDLPVFFEQQADEEANYMAAFTRKDPSDRTAFEAHWRKIIANETIPIKTILFNDFIAGHILSFVMDGKREVSYWIGKDFWGKGIASEALRQFLVFLKERPLYAHVAKDNSRSIRVLEKNGFSVTGESKYFANARSKETEEYIMELPE